MTRDIIRIDGVALEPLPHSRFEIIAKKNHLLSTTKNGQEANGKAEKVVLNSLSVSKIYESSIFMQIFLGNTQRRLKKQEMDLFFQQQVLVHLRDIFLVSGWLWIPYRMPCHQNHLLQFGILHFEKYKILVIFCIDLTLLLNQYLNRGINAIRYILTSYFRFFDGGITRILRVILGFPSMNS